VRFLISTRQNPFVTSTATGDMTPARAAALKRTARKVAADLRPRHGLSAPD
jgi:hypothetical protein